MLLSKLAPRQASLRAFSSVASKLTIGNNVQSVRPRQFQTLHPKQQQQVFESSRNRVPNKFKRSAYQEELNIFNDKLNSFNQVDRIRSSNLLFDLDQSMSIYLKIRNENPFTTSDIARLLQGLHTHIRLTRKQRNKKKAEHKDITQETNTIKSHILTIADDLYNGVVHCTFWGFIHLFTSFATSDCPEEGIALWQKLADPEHSKCANEVWNPQVIGAIIDLMNAANTPFEQILKIYETSKANHEGEPSANLEQAMVGALIKNDKIDEAFHLFKSMLKVYPQEQYSLSRIHDRFVGDCSDIETALLFFYNGIEKKTPYKASTHPSTVVRLMERIWNNPEAPFNLDAVEKVWKAYISSIPRSMGEWMFNTTVHTFLQCFMQTYPTSTPEAVNRLKEIIQFYVTTRVEISPIFLNTVLSSVQPWGDADIVFTTIEAFDIYRLPQDPVSCRIILNSFENIPVSEEMIVERWERLKKVRNSVESLDLLALLRACFPSSREQLFANIFSESLEKGEISDNAILGVDRAIAANERLVSKMDFWKNLLNQNYLEISTGDSGDKLIHHQTAFQVPTSASILDDVTA